MQFKDFYLFCNRIKENKGEKKRREGRGGEGCNETRIEEKRLEEINKFFNDLNRKVWVLKKDREYRRNKEDKIKLGILILFFL